MTVYDELINLARLLSPDEKARLLEDISASLRQDLEATKTQPPKRSLLGLWNDVAVSDADISEAREDLWGNFPREDI